MLDRKPLLVLERRLDAGETVSLEDELGIDGSGDLWRGTPEMTAVCSGIEGKGLQLQLFCPGDFILKQGQKPFRGFFFVFLLLLFFFSCKIH